MLISPRLAWLASLLYLPPLWAGSQTSFRLLSVVKTSPCLFSRFRNGKMVFLLRCTLSASCFSEYSPGRLVELLLWQVTWIICHQKLSLPVRYGTAAHVLEVFYKWTAEW